VIVLNSIREDYLLTIYRLTKKTDYTNSVTLARALNVSRASVSEMVKKLSSEELITFVDNQIRLTDQGRKKARNIISVHRLWEFFLMEHLHLSDSEAHEQAHLLEHVTGEALREALNEYLDFPTKCPGGNIIWDNFAPEETAN
jgi:DtxR family Mn-dependent transcriptional regulator